MGQVFINGQWVDDGKDSYFDAATNLRTGPQGVGSDRSGYVTPPGLPTVPLAPPPADAVAAGREARYQASRGAALDLQAIRDRNALSDMPTGSPTSYLGSNGQVVGTASTDELGVPKPTPTAAVGLRGYPTVDEINAGNARQAAQSKEDQFNTDINSFMGGHPAAPKFQAPTMDQLIDTGIQARRNQIQNEINFRNQRIQSESDQPVAVGGGRYPRYGPSQAAQTRGEIAILSRHAGELDRAQQANIANRSKLALASAKQNEIVSQDAARAQVVDLFSNIDDSRYPHGSADRDRFVGTILGQRPDLVHAIVKDKYLGRFVQDHMETHATVGATMEALKNQYGKDLQFTPSVTDRGDGKVTTTYRGSLPAESKATPKNASTRYAKVLGDIAYHQKNQATEKSSQPNQPYSDQAKLDGAMIEKQQLEKEFPKLGGAGMVVQIPQAAQQALRDDPSRAEEFEKKFGKGTAAIILR